MNELKSQIFLSVINSINTPLLLIEKKSGKVEMVNQSAGELLSSLNISVDEKSSYEIFDLNIREIVELENGLSRTIELKDIKDRKVSHKLRIWITQISGELSEVSMSLIKLEKILNVSNAPEELNYKRQRVETLGMLAGGIVHDLNNIFTGILGHVSFLKMEGGGNSVFQDSLESIEQGSKRAAKLCQQILHFAKGQPTIQRVVKLEAVVSSSVNLLRASFPKNIKISVHQHGDALSVRGNESQLGQLVINLAVNARDALQTGGRIDIYLDSLDLVETWDLGDEIREPGKYIRLAICDNGVGIPQSLQDEIFQPLFTTKAKKGTGLGLATVATIVNNHGGVIRIDSKESVGTMFEVWFPAVEDLNAEDVREKVEDVPTGDERLLVVDDEEPVRTVIQKSLEHLGYQVATASSGEEALTYFKDNGNKCDLVLLDMMMPQMCGDELFFHLKEIRNDVSVLICSGFISDERAQRVLDEGGKGFIRKPFSVQELALEVRKCLD